MNQALSAIVGGGLGVFLGYFVIGPYFERMERQRRFNQRWARLEQENRDAHEEDKLTDEQLRLIKEEERKYWSIH